MSDGTDSSSEKSSGAWLFVALEGQYVLDRFGDTAVGDIVAWRHGSDQFMKLMQPGDTAFLYRSLGKTRSIYGIGTVLAVRSPFIIDSNLYSDSKGFVQRLLIVVTNVFEEIPYSDVTNESGHRIVKGTGSVFMVPEEATAVIYRKLKENGVPTDIAEPNFGRRAVAVARADLQRFLRDEKNLIPTAEYITAPMRRKLRQEGVDLAVEGQSVLKPLAFDKVVQRVNEAWSEAGRPRPWPQRTDVTSVSDDPVQSRNEDQLDRARMAEILGIRLDRVFAESKKTKCSDVAPFTVLVDAPWGGRKKYVCKFLTRNTDAVIIDGSLAQGSTPRESRQHVIIVVAPRGLVGSGFQCLEISTRAARMVDAIWCIDPFNIKKSARPRHYIRVHFFSYSRAHMETQYC